MMPAYNAESFIDSAIGSILAQKMPDWELVVVNDGSTDQTADLLSQYSDRRIRVYHQKNAGEAAARNHALREVDGEFLAFLDSDDQFLPAFLENMVDFLKANPTLDGVYCDGFYIDPTGQIIGSLSENRRGPFEGSLYNALVRASDVFGPPICVLLRTDSVFTSGVTFDPRIVIGPDWDFFTRLSQTTRFGYLDRKLVCYRVHTTNITVTTGGKKRLSSLALCREKAIHTAGFSNLCLETRAYTFFDLLINLLAGGIKKQIEVTHWEQFQALPDSEQARLYRLMASQLLQDVTQQHNPQILSWLRQARRQSHRDWKSVLLQSLYVLSPRLSAVLLRARAVSDRKTSFRSPFTIRD